MKTKRERKEKFQYQYVAQCDKCHGVELIVDEKGKKVRQKSIAIFETLKKDRCYSCQVTHGKMEPQQV